METFFNIYRNIEVIPKAVRTAVSTSLNVMYHIAEIILTKMNEFKVPIKKTVEIHT